VRIDKPSIRGLIHLHACVFPSGCSSLLRKRKGGKREKERERERERARKSSLVVYSYDTGAFDGRFLSRSRSIRSIPERKIDRGTIGGRITRSASIHVSEVRRLARISLEIPQRQIDRGYAHAVSGILSLEDYLLLGAIQRRELAANCSNGVAGDT